MIRVMVGESDHRKWTRESSIAPELMRHIFGADALPISVYRVNAGIEEAKAVAAHYLPLPDNHSRVFQLCELSFRISRVSRSR
jgi:hypothetical protein